MTSVGRGSAPRTKPLRCSTGAHHHQSDDPPRIADLPPVRGAGTSSIIRSGRADRKTFEDGSRARRNGGGRGRVGWAYRPCRDRFDSSASEDRHAPNPVSLPRRVPGTAGRSRPRAGGRPHAPAARCLRDAHHVRLCRRHLGRAQDRRGGSEAELAGRRGVVPAVLAGRPDHRVHRQLRRQRRCLYCPNAGRPGHAADAPPHGRPDRGLVFGGRCDSLRLIDGQRPAALQPALQGHARGRPAGEAAHPVRRVRRHLAGRRNAGVHAEEPGLPHLEAIPRRLGARYPAVRPE